MSGKLIRTPQKDVTISGSGSCWCHSTTTLRQDFWEIQGLDVAQLLLFTVYLFVVVVYCLCVCLQGLFDTASVEYTDYIRTTEERHINCVRKFWVRPQITL